MKAKADICSEHDKLPHPDGGTIPIGATDPRAKVGPAPKTWRAFALQNRWLLFSGAAVLMAVIVIGTLWWFDARHYESTDDAFIDTHAALISGQVTGAIVALAVTDNQLVDVGTLLVTIDPRDYKAKLEQAEALINQAKAAQSNFKAQIDEQLSTIEEAVKVVAQSQASLVFAREQQERAKELAVRGSGTVQNAQQTNSQLRQNEAAVATAQAAVTAANKQNAVLGALSQNANAQLQAAEAGRLQAQTDLSRTAIRAPVAGYVTGLSAASGDYASAGQSLMILVPRELWVTANFKETQLQDMRPGQPVTIRIDSYPQQIFNGHVDSIQSGSGTAFALFPPQNATGNYVKVVQRVPVKIVFDSEPDVHLGPGMSVAPSVKVR